MNKTTTKRRWPIIVTALVLAVMAGILVGEWFGWPFLAGPLQRLVSDMLNRRVQFHAEVAASSQPAKDFQVRFLGGVQLKAAEVEVAAPSWSAAPHMFVGRDVELRMRYIDLWRAHIGEPIRVEGLKAATVDGNLERLIDGRASWQFGPEFTPAALAMPPPPRTVFGDLQVANGTVRYRDAVLRTDVEVHLSLSDAVTGNPKPGTAAPISTSDSESVLQATATGQYIGLPMTLQLASKGILPWTTDAAHAIPLPMTLNATVGRAEFVFNGTATDARRLSGFTGHFSLKGPSLAAVGEPLGVTLPTTPAFRSEGVIVRRSETWHVVIDDAMVGSSRMKGAFTYEAGQNPRLLSGQLGGSRLLLADLGPAVGMAPGASVRAKGMVLPNRPFDLASLRNMDANVLLDFAELDLGGTLLAPLRPMHGHLQLTAGVLSVNEIDARTVGGRFQGELRLDGRQSSAVWNANLRWDGVQLENWIHQNRADGVPPFVSGKLSGKMTLQGQGRSTAEILATLKGKFFTELKEGRVSHLVVEAAGLDIAESLGFLIIGDKALTVQCGVADLVAEGGVFRPRVMVLDTTDSAIWVDGSLSMATEALDLKAVVTPKDFSPLTLRTPLLVRGTFANPKVSIEKGPLGKKLATSFLLALVNPLAALIPLIDRGDPASAKTGAAGCQSLMQRSEGQRTAAARVR